MMQERIEKFEDLAAGVILGKIDPLSIGSDQRHLETQLSLYADLFEAIKNYLRPVDKTKLGREVTKMFSRELGVLQGRDRYNLIFYDRNDMRSILFSAEGFNEILDFIMRDGNNTLNIYLDLKEIKSLSKKELEHFGHFNYYFTHLNVSYENSKKDPENHSKELIKIYTNENFDPLRLIDAFYRLLRVSVRGDKDDYTSVEFPEFSVASKNPAVKKSISNSVFGYLLYGLIREEDGSNREVIERVFEALNNRLDSAVNELNQLSISSDENQINTTLANFSRWIDLISILGGHLGERTNFWGSDSTSIRGWANFITNKSLANKLPKFISAVEEKFRALHSHLPKDSEKKRIDLLYSLVKLGSMIKNKVFSNGTSDIATEINGQSSLSPFKKRKMPLRT